MGKILRNLAKIRTHSRKCSHLKKGNGKSSSTLKTQVAIQRLLLSEAGPQCDVAQLFYKQETETS